MKAKAKLELYQEYPEPDEDEIARKIVKLMKEQMTKNSPTGKTLRDVHAKTHGCLKAYFDIETGLTDELRVGVFKEEKTFPAWIRFSNAGALAPIGGVAGDSKPDVRGMAIKLLGVEGSKIVDAESDAQTQDFLLITASTFVTPGPAEFYDLMVAQTTGLLALSMYVVSHPGTALGLYRSLTQHADPLELQYFSAVPFAFGSKAVKYSAKPSLTRKSELPRNASDHHMRDIMKERLAYEEVTFDFLIQFQADPYEMPIENAAMPWDEKRSPFIKIASIRIPRQNFDSDAQMEYCENLSFSPWHSFNEHRPLGSINRVRRSIYRGISSFRHERNSVADGEPTVESFNMFGLQ